MYHGKVCFLGETSLWSKKYFIFVSTLDYLQREHYCSSFRLLPSSGFLFAFSPSSLSFSFTVILSFSGSVKALGECEGSDSHNTDSVWAGVVDAEMKKREREKKKLLGICSCISVGLGYFPRKRPTITV